MAGCGEVLLFLSSEAVASFSFAVSRVFRIEKVTDSSWLAVVVLNGCAKISD